MFDSCVSKTAVLPAGLSWTEMHDIRPEAFAAATIPAAHRIASMLTSTAPSKFLDGDFTIGMHSFLLGWLNGWGTLT